VIKAFISLVTLINDGRPPNGLSTWQNTKDYLIKEADTLVYKMGNMRPLIKERRVNPEGYERFKYLHLQSVSLYNQHEDVLSESEGKRAVNRYHETVEE
jgi:hypothetical protein